MRIALTIILLLTTSMAYVTLSGKANGDKCIVTFTGSPSSNEYESNGKLVVSVFTLTLNP